MVYLSPLTANAQVEPRHRIIYRSLTAAQWNPLGLQSELDLGYRYLMFRSDSRVFQENYLAVLSVAKLNPAYARVGGAVELQPMAILTLRGEILWRGYFGSFNMLQSFSSADADYRDSTLKERGEAGLNYRGSGYEVKAEATLRFKLGPIAVINQLMGIYSRLNLEGSDRLFYDAYLDVLVPNKRWTLANHAHLLYVTKFGLLLGARYSLVHAFYPESWLAPGAENPNSPTHRLGPIALYTFKYRRNGFENPTVIVILNWWLQHRYRAGQDISQGVPYGVVAFRFQGDLWSR
jgi:hypothetical protein